MLTVGAIALALAAVPFGLIAAYIMVVDFGSGAQDCAGGACNTGPLGAFIAGAAAYGLFHGASKAWEAQRKLAPRRAPKAHSCPVCHDRYRDVDRLRRHVERNHDQVPCWLCYGAQKPAFDSFDAYWAHMNRYHAYCASCADWYRDHSVIQDREHTRFH